MNPYPPKTGPFIIKLRQAVTTCPPACGRWSADGKRFDVLRPAEFDLFLKKFFVGTEATFLRQLHFYQFRKIDCAHGGGDGVTPGTWSFIHAHFVRDDPEDDVSIKRVVGSTTRARGSTSSSVSGTSNANMVDLALYNKSQAKVAELESQVKKLHAAVEDLEKRLLESEQARQRLLASESPSAAAMQPEDVSQHEPQLTASQQQQSIHEPTSLVMRSDSSLSLFNAPSHVGFDDDDLDDSRCSPVSHADLYAGVYQTSTPSFDEPLANDDMVQDLMLHEEEDSTVGLYQSSGVSEDRSMMMEFEPSPVAVSPAFSRSFSNASYGLPEPSMLQVEPTQQLPRQQPGETRKEVNPSVVTRVVKFLSDKGRHSSLMRHQQEQAVTDVGKLLPMLLESPEFQKTLLNVASSSLRTQSAGYAANNNHELYSETLRPSMDVF